MDPRFSGTDELATSRGATLTLRDAAAAPPLGSADPSRESPADTPGWVGALIAGVTGPVAAVVFTILLLGLWLQAQGLGRGARGEFMTSGAGLFLVVVASEIGLGLFAVAAAVLSPLPWRARLGLTRPRWTPAQALLLIAAAVGITIASGLMIELLHRASLLPAIGDDRMKLAQRLFDLPLRWVVPMTVAASLLPGICEELLYRGFVQGGLIRRWKPWIAIGVASALFAMAHGDVAYAVFAFPIGLWLGYIAWKSGSVIPGMLCHASVNATFQIAGRLTPGQKSFEVVPIKPNELAMVLAVLLLVFLPLTVFAVRAVRRMAPVTVPEPSADPDTHTDLPTPPA